MIIAYRTEKLGEPMRNIFSSINKIIDKSKDIKAIYTIHMNSIVRETANEILYACDTGKIIEPLDVLYSHNFSSHFYLMLTYSIGIQEDAAILGKLVL